MNETRKQFHTARRRLLILDDIPDHLTMMSVLLSPKYEVFGYTAGQKALSALPCIQPDLMVLDIAMSPLDGVNFLKESRLLRGLEDTLAMAVTAFAREVEIQRFLDAGFEAVVTKPILDLEQFESLIETLLGRGRSLAKGLSRLDQGGLTEPFHLENTSLHGLC